MIDLLIRAARIADPGVRVVDIAIADGRIAAIEPSIVADAPTLDAQDCLVVPGLVDTHLHLDKACIMDRCSLGEGTVAEAVRQTAVAKAEFTTADVYARARRVLERCIVQGTMRVRTQVELDPGIGLRGLDAIEALARDVAPALDLEICVFPQEGLLNRPGTEALLREGLRRGARTVGAAPYFDTDPRGQIDRIFAIAREFDAEIDMHLDLADTTDGMLSDYVCQKTDEYGWGGRVAIGHATQISLLAPDEAGALATRLANAGVAVTILPSTDLYLMGRHATHAIPRGVTNAERLRAAGVTCSVATNNILNPFTPYGDGSLVRMANLYANVCHVARPDELAGCLDMITGSAARLMNLPDYGIAVGNRADLVALDATDLAGAIAALAQPLWGVKAGRISFERPRATIRGLP